MAKSTNLILVVIFAHLACNQMMVNGLLSELNESELKHLGEEIRNRIQRTEAQAAVLKFLQFAETTRDAVELKQRREELSEILSKYADSKHAETKESRLTEILKLLREIDTENHIFFNEHPRPFHPF